MANPRIYLDQAATGWPKHESVYEAVELQMRDVGAAAGRGSYSSSVMGGNVLQSVRRRAAQLFRSDPKGFWVLAANGTAALNMAIHGTVRDGNHVVSTAAEHNSVLRPLEWLRKQAKITLSIVQCDSLGFVSADLIKRSIQPETRLVAMTHGSNVTGAINPIQEIAVRIREVSPDCLILVDTAQTAGICEIDLSEWDIDLLATPGHKGLGGPLGTGLLYVGPRASAIIQPLMQGGTGSQSDSLEMPNRLPDMLESGNQNVPAFAGLDAGLEITQSLDLQQIYENNQQRTELLANQLSEISGITVISASQLPILSITHDQFTPHDLAMILDSEYGIEVRAGLHCVPLIHQHIGSSGEGTVRVSFSASTPDEHLTAVVDALKDISA